MEVLKTVCDSDILDRCLLRLPYRHPTLLVDRVTHIEPGKFLAATKNITRNECGLAGITDNKYYPSTLILESLIQAATILAMHEHIGREHEHTGKQNLLSSLHHAEFNRPVTAGDQLLLTIEAKEKKPYLWLFESSASTEQHIVASAKIALKPIKKASSV